MTLGSMQFAGNVRRVLESLEVLGIDAPADLVNARDGYDAVMGFYGPPVDVSAAPPGITPEQRIKRMERLGEIHGKREQIMAIRVDEIDNAARHAQAILSQNTDLLLTEAAPVIRSAITEVEAEVRSMPRGWEDSALLIEHGGPDAVAALVRAQARVVVLNAGRELRVHLPGTELIGAVAVGATYAKCSDTVVAEEVCRSNDAGSLGFWGQALSVEGVSGLQWHATVAEHRAYVATLPRMAMRHVKEGHGAVLRKVPA